MSEPQKSTFNTSSFTPTCPLDGIVTVDEDFNRTQKSRSTGYMGKNSEVLWMQRLESEATRQDSTGVSLGNDQKYQLPVDNSIASMSYHLDDNRLPGVEATDAFILPSKGLADQLFRVFFNKVHISLPIIRQDLIMAQYHRLFSEASVKPGRKWLAIFNMILAIGSRFCRISQSDAQEDSDEHVFFARAKSLNISENALYDHDDLQLVQAETLMAFYFLASSQINRYVSTSVFDWHQLYGFSYVSCISGNFPYHGK